MHTRLRHWCYVGCVALAVCTTADCRADIVPDGPEFQVNSRTVGSQANPQIAALSSGRFVIVWDGPTSASDTEDVVWARNIMDQAPAAAEFQVNTTTGISGNRRAAVAASPSGGFVIVWENAYLQDGSYAGIFGQRFASTGVPTGEEFRVNSYTPFTQVGPAVAAAPDGSFVVLWRDRGEPDGDPKSDIQAQRFSALGTIVGTEFTVAAGPTGDPFDPRVTATPSGGFVVTWSELYRDGQSDGVFARRYDSEGVAIESAFQVNTYTTSAQRFADLAICPTGEFVVAWVSFFQDGSGTGIFGQRFDASGNRLGSESQVNTYTIGDQTTPIVAATDDCRFVFAWQSFGQDGDDGGVIARSFAGDLLAGDPEFQVNGYTTSTQGGRSARGIDIAVDDGGGFFIVWSSREQDGDRTGIFAQRFCIDPPTPAHCGDSTCTGSAQITSTDALALLMRAVRLGDCEPCVCDVDNSGAVTATDALRVLQNAAGLDSPLTCPPCP